MKVGFTGTADGMTLAQKRALRGVMNSIRMGEFHHGSCVGADAQAHHLALGRCEVHVHPSTLRAKTAPCLGYRMYPPRPPLDRNHDIVDATEMLIATPRGEDEELRSGTWATVRYARKKKRPIILVLPDGRVVGDGTSPGVKFLLGEKP